MQTFFITNLSISSSFCQYHPCLGVEWIIVFVQEARKRFDKASLLYDQVCGSDCGINLPPFLM